MKIAVSVRIVKLIKEKISFETSRNALQTLIQLAEDYLALLDNKLLPKEKEGKSGEQYQKWNSKENIYEYGKRIGFNTAIYEVKLRHLKNRMSVEEIKKIIEPTLKQYFGSTIWLLNNNIATAIFKAIEKKMKGE